MIEPVHLREFVCIPSTEGAGIQHLDYFGPDGSLFASAQRHSKACPANSRAIPGCVE